LLQLRDEKAPMHWLLTTDGFQNTEDCFRLWANEVLSICVDCSHLQTNQDTTSILHPTSSEELSITMYTLLRRRIAPPLRSNPLNPLCKCNCPSILSWPD